MIRSFLNAFLPEDEYRRKQILYFMAEALFLIVGAFLLLGLLVYVFNSFSVNSDLLVFLSPFLMIAYVNFRYIFTGMEYTEVFQERDYTKERRYAIVRSLVAGSIFTIALLVIKGLPTNMSETLDITVLPIIFIVFYFIIECISLKRSINKNKELDD
ncbi:MAG TPA: hypothetical protein VK056_04195 [Bacillota bacterium]|nr:hypothetical protein [Bacillota bacterium]